MSVSLTDARTLLAFKAGRSFRRGSTNFVDASPTKGAIMLSNSEDSLLRFVWKERTTGNIEEDLILFPGDATFEKVSQAPGGRTYVLKFESSDQKHFDASSRRDDEFVHNLNRLTCRPKHHCPSTSTPGASTSQASPAPYATPAGHRHNPRTSSPDLRALVTSMGANSGPNHAQPNGSSTQKQTTMSPSQTFSPPLTCSPSSSSHPALLPSLFPHLPQDLLPSSNAPLTSQQTAQLTESLQRTINSPPFRTAVAQLDRALRTGALGGFVRSLGLPGECWHGGGSVLEGYSGTGQEGGARRERAG
ncbi:adhesion regulating molecule [Melanogaster broomeanus]|nr:adhesion regulating molecule [Melanogaster broomeanus]